MKNPNSKRVNDLLKYRTKAVALYDNLLTISDTDEKFELKEYLLKMITNKNYKVDLANL